MIGRKVVLLKDNDKDLIDYVDTRITDIILRAMTNNEIPCLPVHDSYIVKERDKNFLIEVMKESYEYIMQGFSPIIK